MSYPALKLSLSALFYPWVTATMCLFWWKAALMNLSKFLFLRSIVSNFLQTCIGHDLGWVNWCMQHQEVHRLGSHKDRLKADICAEKLNRNRIFFNHCRFSWTLAFKMIRFWQSRSLWKALEELYNMIATIIKCIHNRGRKSHIYFLLAFKSCFTVYLMYGYFYSGPFSIHCCISISSG